MIFDREKAYAYQRTLAAERVGIEIAVAVSCKLTHDCQLVLPPDAPLPVGASGFIQCQLTCYSGLGTGSYATWIEPEDQPRSKADYDRIEREAKAFRTKAQAEAALRAIGVQYPGGMLRHMRTQYQVRAYARLWPLRENPGRVVKAYLETNAVPEKPTLNVKA